MDPFAYLIISLFFTSCMLSIIFFVAWRSFGREPHALMWALAFSCGAFQWLLNSIGSSWFDDRRLYWMTASATAIIVISLAYGGFRLWANLNPRWGRLALAGIAVWLAIGWHTIVERHVGWSMSLGLVFSASLCICCAAIIVQRSPRTLAAEYGAATVFLLFGVSQFVVAWAAFMQGPELNEDYLAIYRQVNFLALPTAYIGMGLFTVFILASDLSEQMKKLARTDQLTGLLNRRGFHQTSDEVIADARTDSKPLSLVLLDLDAFKTINDKHGHPTGDATLVSIGRFLSNCCGPSERAARLGGEEFVVIMPGSDLAQATERAEQLRQQLAALMIVERHPSLRITASFGVATLRDADSDLYDLFKRADRAMYQSKRSGRNRVSAETN
ncbi:MAG: hypothetical protein DHS20C11_29200 [Lysobacteraceae bacterium]|nr:MAG: hypothetical protein DHS20C11_29200 [Xanthomonadaceae bacterium]